MSASEGGCCDCAGSGLDVVIVCPQTLPEQKARESCKARIDFDASQPSKNVMAGFLRRTAGLAFASHQGAEHGAEKGASAARGVEGARRSPAGQKGGRRVHRRLSKRGRGKVGEKAFPALAADQ
jgi:hypothetical protein